MNETKRTDALRAKQFSHPLEALTYAIGIAHQLELDLNASRICHAVNSQGLARVGMEVLGTDDSTIDDIVYGVRVMKQRIHDLLACHE